MSCFFTYSSIVPSICLVGAQGLEPCPTVFLHDRRATVTPSTLMAEATGFEPVNDGVKVRCVTTSPSPNGERAVCRHLRAGLQPTPSLYVKENVK